MAIAGMSLPAALLVLGLIWSPLGATYLLHLTARSDVRVTWKDGALASAAFLLPWVYLYLRIRWRLLNSFVVRWALGLFLFIWFLITVVPFVYASFDFLFNDTDWAGQVHTYNTRVLWAIFAGTIALFNCAIMSCALCNLREHRIRISRQIEVGIQSAYVETPYLMVFGASLVIYILFIPEIVLMVLVTLLTGCANCMWE